MTGKIEHFWDKINTNGLDKNKGNINRDWRPLSFKKEFKKFLEADWSVTFPSKNIKKINEDWSVTVIFPKKEAIVIKALNWAMSNKGPESTKMIQRIVEMFDWKAKQPSDLSVKGDITLSSLLINKQKQDEE